MKFILTLALSIIVALFAIQNSASVPVKILLYSVHISQALVILISAILGAIIAFSLSLLKQFSLNKNLKNQNKSIQQLESELANTRLQLAQTETKLAEQSHLANNITSYEEIHSPEMLPEAIESTETPAE